MDTKESLSDKSKDLLEKVHEGAGQVQQSIKREVDSIDDFEHLGHDISPLKEFREGDRVPFSEPARELLGEINKGVGSVAKEASKLAGELKFDPPPSKDSLFDKPHTFAMDSNLLELAETFPDRKEADAKLDKFLSEITSISAPTEKELKENVKERVDDFKSASQNFMDMERGGFAVKPPSIATSHDLIEHYSDSDAEDDFKPSNGNFAKVTGKSDTFKDLDDFELPKVAAPVLQPEKITQQAKPAEPKSTEPEKSTQPIINLPEPVKVVEPVKTPEPAKQPETVKSDFQVQVSQPAKASEPEPVKAPEPEKTYEPIMKPAKAAEPKKIEEPPAVTKLVKKDEPETVTKKVETKVKTEAEAMFCKMGLVADLIYWRDPKKSGPVFGGVLVVLLALTYFSLISVVAYLSLLALTGTISFRIYKNVVQAVQKTGDGHPFKEVLESDLSLPQEKVEDLSKVAVAHINAAVVELRRLFLVEDLVDSIKFGVLLWCLTYLGAWFNGMTLIIIAWVALFTLPKVYETNKTQIDANLDIVRTKLEEITSKVRAAIPIGKKPEEKKQQ